MSLIATGSAPPDNFHQTKRAKKPVCQTVSDKKISLIGNFEVLGQSLAHKIKVAFSKTFSFFLQC